MDSALEILEGTAPEYCGGLINHGPMVAEAMIALGRPDAVIGWIGYYSRRLQRRVAGSAPVTIDNWPGMLGNRGFSEWFDFFEPIASASSVDSLLRQWVPSLAPGLSAAALHGFIRTGHAVRSLTSRETPLRRSELASGLAYWASHYQVLPGRISGDTETFPPAQAIRRIIPVPRREQRPYGLIGRKLQDLKNFAPFERGLVILDTGSDLNRFLSDLTETFAGVYLTNARNLSTATTLMHTVTAPCALRSILPFLARKDAEIVPAYIWQACAAFFSVTADRSENPEFRINEKNNLIDFAINTGDEHAIKFTEACLREYALNPKPVYIQAAWDAVERIGELSELN